MGWAIVLGAWGAACNQADPVLDAPLPQEMDCALASERLGHRACVHTIDDAAQWQSVTEPSMAVGAVRQTKHLLPARPDARVSALFLDVNHELDHYAMLTEAFPERFAGMTMERYAEAILGGVDRELYAGPLVEYALTGDTRIFGYSIWDDPAVPTDALTCMQLLDAQAQLDARVGPGPRVFVPLTSVQAAMAEDCGVVHFDPGQGVPYEVYSVGTGYGYVRPYTLPELQQAQLQAGIDWRDIVVIDQAPFDLSVVVSGMVSGARQAALSHLNVRSQARGTPSCYVRDAAVLLSQWEGQLVRLDCRESQWSVTEATRDEAEAYWATLRPDPVQVPVPDTSTTIMPSLRALPTATVAARARAVAAYGGKGRSLAALYQRYDGPQLSGLLVPMSGYAGLVEQSSWEVDLGTGPASWTFAQTLEAWLDDPAFVDDAAERNLRLGMLRHAMEQATPDPALVERIALRAEAVFGETTRMLRFRSSSNAEDSLRFSGAGLYASTRVCVADSLDDDALGPSRCDPDEPDERTIERGLVTVWSSLWSPAAYAERDWYGIDHRQVAMGILVNDRIDDEQANVVAFTGNPTAPTDPRWLVDAQIGAIEVVSSEPDVVPERVLLEVADGMLVQHWRVGPSSEVPTGVVVLDDVQLQDLATRLAEVVAVFPVDEAPPVGMRVVLDTEWKVTAEGALVIKQVRPQLLPVLP